MIPLAKNIKRYFSLKEVTVVFLAVIISVSAGIGVFLGLKKEVVINVDGKQSVVKTMKTTVAEVLQQNGIKLGAYDYINEPLNTKLQRIKKNEIDIKRAVPVNVFVDGKEEKLMTYRDTVKEALDNSPIKLDAMDKLVGATLDTKVSKGLSFSVVRVKEETVTEKSAVPFRVETRENSRLNKGTEQTVREGQDGVREKLYKVIYEDGKEVARTLISDAVTANPIDKIVELGTVLNYKTSRGEVIRYSKVLKMRSTAYTASYSDTGKSPGDPGFGVTYTGMKVRKGIIAVDPKVIPLGTRVYVEVAGDTPDYGYAIAGDIGGAIKGNLIDLYFDSQGTVNSWGCKSVKVYILLDD